MGDAKLFSYVVHHDTGHAPNPYFGVCTLCRCKYRKSRTRPKNIVELAKPGDWIVGTGGANKKKSAGHHKLVYAMKVDQIITREQYFETHAFASKKPTGKKCDFRSRGDNLEPTNQFRRKNQFVLISKKRFYYFGENAILIPRDKLPHLEKKGPGFRSDFDAVYIRRFEKWIKSYKKGRLGNPWVKQAASKEKRASICASSC